MKKDVLLSSASSSKSSVRSDMVSHTSSICEIFLFFKKKKIAMGWELLRPDQAFVHASNRFSRFHCLISLFISDLCFCLFMVCDSFKDGCHVAREDQSEEAEQARHHPNLVSDDLCSSILCLIHEDESVDLFFCCCSQRRDSQPVGSDGSSSFWDFDGY